MPRKLGADELAVEVQAGSLSIDRRMAGASAARRPRRGATVAADCPRQEECLLLEIRRLRAVAQRLAEETTALRSLRKAA
ncbi:MAG: hypothetical protein M1401_03440 [Chloroflexi bacterium]|nr:hypothetical protein [Chloroflexota bacterium]MCL5107920.1 hypothetical protein [Chloroflexota bacterium]